MINACSFVHINYPVSGWYAAESSRSCHSLVCQQRFLHLLSFLHVFLHIMQLCATINRWMHPILWCDPLSLKYELVQVLLLNRIFTTFSMQIHGAAIIFPLFTMNGIPELCHKVMPFLRSTCFTYNIRISWEVFFVQALLIIHPKQHDKQFTITLVT